MYDPHTDEPIEITATNQQLPTHDAMIAAGEGSYNVGNPGINWERYYECLELQGWDMQALGSPIDNRIRRFVRQAVKDGEIT